MTGRPGRPSTGIRIEVRIPAPELDALDTIAVRTGRRRPEVIRDAVTAYLERLHDLIPADPH